MTLNNLIDYALSKPDAEECLPFGPDVLVFKIKGKVFLLIPLNSFPIQFNAKCDPEKAILLREEYAAIIPGYHMNKKHWNTIIIDDSIPNAQIIALVDHSYELVVKGTKPRNKNKPPYPNTTYPQGSKEWSSFSVTDLPENKSV